MKPYLIIGCLCLNSINVQAESVTIYKFLDEKGVLHLSNKPPKKQDELLYSRSYVVQSFVPPRRLMPLIIPIPDFEPEFTPKPKTAKKSSATSTQYIEQIKEVADHFNLSPALLQALITVESNFKADAVSPKGAIGLMQIIPATGKRYGATDLTDPMTNLQCGANYLSDLLKLFDQDLTLALAAYNAGENAVIRYGNKIPPYTETQNYVKKVTALYHTFITN